MSPVARLSTDGLQPPYNVEAEMGVLGHILYDNACYDAVAPFLRSEYFAGEAHDRIYAACTKLIERGQRASPVTLKGYFEHDSGLEDIGGVSYLAKLANATLVTHNTQQLGELVFDAWQRRNLAAECQRTFQTAHHDEDVRTADELIEEHMATLDKLRAGEHKAGSVSVSNAVDHRLTEIETGTSDIGIKTGLTAFDDITGGLFRGETALLGGRPGAGKTGCAVTIAINSAIAGHRAVFFSLEETQAGVANRVLSRFSGVSVARLKHDTLDLADKSLLVDVRSQVEHLPLIIDPRPSLTIPAIRSETRSQMRKGGVDLVIVDHLGLVKSTNSKADRFDVINEASRGVKELAKELDVAVLACIQLNRATENREDRRPGLSDLRQSGQLEEDARMVAFLYREAYYMKRPARAAADTEHTFQKKLLDWEADYESIKHQADVFIAKQNSGPTGQIRLRFEPVTTMFRDELN